MPRPSKSSADSTPSEKKALPVAKKNKVRVNKKGEKNEESGAELFKKVKSDYRWKVFGQSAFITLSSIFLLGGLGWLIDSWIPGEKHAFFILFLIISYPLTQFALYKKMRNFKPSQKER